MSTVFDATVARPTTYSGANGNVVVKNAPYTLTGITLNGGAAGATFRVFDNATTNSGTVLFAATLAATTAATYMFPVPIKANNGVTINASAAGAAGAIYGMGGPRSQYAVSISGAIATNVVASATPKKLYGFSVNANNTATAAVVSFFDNATTSTGTLLYSATIPVQTAANTQMFLFPTQLQPSNGITASVSGSVLGDITLWVG